MKELSVHQMEEIEGGKMSAWLEIGCIVEGLALSLATGAAAPVVATFTVHACGAYVLSKITV